MRVVLCHTDEHADVFLKEGERLSSGLPMRVHNIVVTAFREAVVFGPRLKTLISFSMRMGSMATLHPNLAYLFASELRDIGKAEAEKIINFHKKTKRD